MSEVTQAFMTDSRDVIGAARPLAENITQHDAANTVKNTETRTLPAGLLHSAWAHAEYGLNKACSTDEAGYYFETTDMLLGEIINRGHLVGEQEVHQDVLLHALILSTYMPLLVSRARGEGIGERDCRRVYESLGRALQYLQPLEVDEPPQGRMVEAAVLTLSARIGRPELLLYPASPREECSETAFNHDCYFYTGSDKIPIQQKLIPTEREYDEEITLLVLEPMITKALQASGESRKLLASEKVNILLGRVIAEAVGTEMEKHETKFLNVVTRAVASHHAGLRACR